MLGREWKRLFVVNGYFHLDTFSDSMFSALRIVIRFYWWLMIFTDGLWWLPVVPHWFIVVAVG